MRKTLCLSSILILASLHTGFAQPGPFAWPMFRYNAQHTGRSPYTGPPDVSLHWSYAAGASIEYSSPAIGPLSGISFGSHDNNIYSVDSSGNLRWSYLTGDYVESSPAFGSANVGYVRSHDGRLYGLLGAGRLSWSYTTGPDLAIAAAVDSSPLIGSVGEIYFGAQDNNIYSLDSPGGLRWSYAAGLEVTSSPAMGFDGRIYIGSSDNNLYSLSSAGAFHWSYTTGISISRSSPAIAHDSNIHVGSSDRNFYAFTSAGALSWSYTTGDVLYSSPAIGSDGGVYLPGRDNALYAFTPHGALQWSFIAAGKMESSPALGSDGSIYVGDGGYLYALSSSGTLIWSFLIGNSMSSSPSISSNGRLYVGSNDNCMYCFGEFIPTPTATPTPNYINLTVTPAMIVPGGPVTLAYACDFSIWNYQGVPVNIYIAAIKNPLVADAASTVSDALGGGTVYLFGKNMKHPYVYTGKVKEPTFKNVPFPPVPIAGSLTIIAPSATSFAGNWVFATAFIRKDTGQFVRTDLPVENSNLFVIH